MAPPMSQIDDTHDVTSQAADLPRSRLAAEGIVFVQVKGHPFWCVGAGGVPLVFVDASSVRQKLSSTFDFRPSNACLFTTSDMLDLHV